MASGVIWDPYRLSDDKLSVEFNIHGIDSKDPDAYRKLVEIGCVKNAEPKTDQHLFIPYFVHLKKNILFARGS